nr:alkaline phosphatase family protein [Candidatus Omnitrophota bacterium]
RDPFSPLYDPHAHREYKEIVETWYERLDLVLADVMAALGSDDTIIVLSDHGFTGFRRAVHLNSWLQNAGFLTVKAGAEKAEDLLKNVDWQKTKAYSLGFGGIYLNQQGREGSGIVASGQEAESLKKEIQEKLLAWTDGDKGEPVVSNVYSKEEMVWGAYANEAPDLFVGFNKGFRASWQTALGAAPGPVIEDNLKKWSGDHLVDPSLVPGVLFMNKQIVTQDPSIMDVAPTILSIIGYSVDELRSMDLDGKNLL